MKLTHTTILIRKIAFVLLNNNSAPLNFGFDMIDCEGACASALVYPCEKSLNTLQALSTQCCNKANNQLPKNKELYK